MACNSIRLDNEETRWDKTEERLKMTQIISPANQLTREHYCLLEELLGQRKG